MSIEKEEADGGDRKELIIDIDGCEHRVADAVVSGGEVLEIAERHPVDEYIVYWLGKDNVLEDLGLEKTVHLHEHGVQRFLTFESDRSYRFEIEGKREDWGAPTISEETIRKLAGVGADFRVWLDGNGKPDRLIERGEFVDLTAPGIERFHLEHIIFVHVDNEDDGHSFTLEGVKSTTIESLIDEIYVEVRVQRREDDRLRCEGGGDVFPFSKLTLGQYIEAGHCPCRIWLFASGTGGASWR